MDYADAKQIKGVSDDFSAPVGKKMSLTPFIPHLPQYAAWF
jgi:hypothetical protein